MRTFSQRTGIKPVRTLIQRESMDDDLRNFLWNILSIFYIKRFIGYFGSTEDSLQTLITRLWIRYFKHRLDELPEYTPTLAAQIKSYFLKCSWNEVYDLLEFFPNNFKEPEYRGGYDNETNLQFISSINSILEEHLSAYRFVDKLITEISSEEEIASIEEALEETSGFKPVQTHLKRALELFADRTNPDYRNSIKESVSAIESLSCIITQNPKATLGQALKEIEKNHELHPALKSSFSSLYGYTSDSDGIRHSLLEESTLKQEDAKFMLVACSAFVNYLLVKASEK